MVKSKKQDDQPEDEAAIVEKMNEALKRMMNTPPETHEEMVRRRRGASNPKRAHKDQTIIHKSDCAVHDAPAYQAGACTCGAASKARR